MLTSRYISGINRITGNLGPETNEAKTLRIEHWEKLILPPWYHCAMHTHRTFGGRAIKVEPVQQQMAPMGKACQKVQHIPRVPTANKFPINGEDVALLALQEEVRFGPQSY